MGMVSEKVNEAMAATESLRVPAVTSSMGFFAENWAQIIILIFMAVHAFIAVNKFLYERKKRDDVK